MFRRRLTPHTRSSNFDLMSLRAFHHPALGLAIALTAAVLERADAAPGPDATRVTILGYHRFENPPRDSLAISTAEFRRQMQELRNRKLTVISLDDFLAWHAGEKELPEECVLITIDDGYVSGYDEAWPVLQEFGYPFVMFVYTNYISAGGKSITWEQLREMHVAGVAVESHSVSHANLTKLPRKAEGTYQDWLWNELKTSMDTISREIGRPVRTIAYPYGIYDETVQTAGEKAGYAAQFTVAGAKITRATPANEIGRYVVLSDNPSVFEAAINFTGNRGATGIAATELETAPAGGAVIADPLPVISADLSGAGTVDPASVKLVLSGFGQLPAVFDPATGVVSYRMRDRLHGGAYTTTVSAKADGKPVAGQWMFTFDPRLRIEALFSNSAPPPVPANPATQRAGN